MDTNTRSLTISTASRNPRNATRESGSHRQAAKKPHSTVVAKQRLSTEILLTCFQSPNNSHAKAQREQSLTPAPDSLEVFASLRENLPSAQRTFATPDARGCASV